MRTITLLLAAAMLTTHAAHAQSFRDWLVLDGSDDFVEVPDDNQLDDASTLTVEVRFRAESLTTRLGLISKWDRSSSNSDNAWGVRTSNSEADEIFVFVASGLGDSGNHIFSSSNADLVTSEWYHLAFVFDGNGDGNADRLKVYLNGEQLEGSYAGTIAVTLQNSSQPLRIGSRLTRPGHSDFAGNIDEARIWRVARSQAQLQTTMSDTLSTEYYAVPDSGLVGYWRFDMLEDLGINADGSDDVRDLSVEDNHGDLTGDATLSMNPTSTDPDGATKPSVLSQVYPNPFNPEAVFTLTLAEPQKVRVSVHDILGREVDLIHEGLLASGERRFSLRGEALPSGVYLVRVAGEQFTAVRRAVLLR